MDFHLPGDPDGLSGYQSGHRPFRDGGGTTTLRRVWAE